MASFAAFATRNLTTFLAGILIDSPVAGLRPMRALRSTRTSLPIPGSTKTPFFFTSLTARLARAVQNRARLLIRDFACFRQPTNQLGLRHSLSGHQTSCRLLTRTSICVENPVFIGFQSTLCSRVVIIIRNSASDVKRKNAQNACFRMFFDVSTAGARRIGRRLTRHRRK